MGDELGRTLGLLHSDADFSARDILEAGPDALVVADETGTIVDLNRATEQLFGYSRHELLGRPAAILLSERCREAVVREWRQQADIPARRLLVIGSDVYGLRKEGSQFPVEITLAPLATTGRSFTIAALRDVSERERTEAERGRAIREQALQAHISSLARKDPLTGLPNRTVLHDRMAAAIRSARLEGRRLAVLFLDVDRFKQVNDSLGHAIGDWLIESVSLRISGTLGASDTASRQGGDEFVILMPEVESREQVARAAEAMLAAVSGSHRVGIHQLHVSASMGIAMYPDDGQDSETLIKNADIAMYYAKDHGRDNFQFFDEEMNARVVERHAVEGSLRDALERREFVLYYQPKIDLATGAMIGAEALLRWQHPERGLIRPERFVPVAEDSGLIVPIGRWVLREACVQAQTWSESGLSPVPVAVNISAIEFRTNGFLDGVRRVLRETRLDPHLLELELTESALMESVAATATALRELKSIGVRVAVDDFGTGYSSLSYLTKLPIDALKVDQSFVREIRDGGQASPIITAVISMGKSLNHRVIAEGVETAEQLAFLQAQRCEEGQGFHFSRPLVASRFTELLEPVGTTRS